MCIIFKNRNIIQTICSVSEPEIILNLYDVNVASRNGASDYLLKQDNEYWKKICKYNKLTESFMRRFKNRIDWINVSRYQRLTESFIGEFKNNINWQNVCEYQNLTEPFIQEHINRIYWYNICQNREVLPLIMCDKYWEYIEWALK